MAFWKPIFPPPSENAVEDYEARFGCELPTAYRRFLHSMNGGTPSGYLGFRIPDLPEERCEVLIGALYGLGERGHGLDLATQTQEWADALPKGFIPIGEDPGGNQLLVSVEGTLHGQIYF